jgi:regulatory protein
MHDSEESWQQILERQYLKKYKNRPVEDYNDKAKRIRFLQYRGFSLDAIYRTIG